jgi:hypothetical protein
MAVSVGLIKASEEEFEANYAVANAHISTVVKVRVSLGKVMHLISGKNHNGYSWQDSGSSGVWTDEIDENKYWFGNTLSFVPGSFFGDRTLALLTNHGNTEIQNVMKEFYNMNMFKEINGILLKELIVIVYDYCKYEMSKYMDISWGRLNLAKTTLDYDCGDSEKVREALRQRRYKFTEIIVAEDEVLFTDIKPACSLLAPFDIGNDPEWAQLGIDRMSEPSSTDI